MSRDQAINLVRLYDGMFPSEYLDMYLDYYQMSEDEFMAVIDRWANKDILEKRDGFWKPKFSIS